MAELFAAGAAAAIESLVLAAYTPQLPDIEEKLGGRVGMRRDTYQLLQQLPAMQVGAARNARGHGAICEAHPRPEVSTPSTRHPLTIDHITNPPQ